MRSRVISSSAPKGSSMSSSGGSKESARAIDDALLHPAGELPRAVALEAGELDELEHLVRPARTRRLRSQPSISSGSAMFFATVRQS